MQLCEAAEASQFSKWRVSNMVAVADCGFPIRLEGLHLAHSKFSSYEPELFPGLIWRMTNPKVVILVFVRCGRAFPLSPGGRWIRAAAAVIGRAVRKKGRFPFRALPTLSDLSTTTTPRALSRRSKLPPPLSATLSTGASPHAAARW